MSKLRSFVRHKVSVWRLKYAIPYAVLLAISIFMLALSLTFVTSTLLFSAGFVGVIATIMWALCDILLMIDGDDPSTVWLFETLEEYKQWEE